MLFMFSPFCTKRYSNRVNSCIKCKYLQVRLYHRLAKK
nr:MAG TPA: hypothetical protein [Caudoviricetes sp.]